MPTKALITLLMVTACVLGTGFLLSTENRFQFDWLAGSVDPLLAPPSESFPPGSAPTSQSAGTGGPTPPGEDPVAFMLASVADQYAQSIRYPTWSVPLTKAQARAYRGNQYEPVALPLGDGGQFAVTLEKYRFTRGEPLLVMASVQGPQIVGQSLKATLESIQTGNSVASTTLPQSGSDGYYQGQLSTDEAPGEYRLIVEATVDGTPVRHASTLTIEPDLGDFEGLGDPYISDNNLVIPVKFAPQDAGFYALSAQLYAGQRPLAQLQSEQRLDSTSDTLNLRAHGTVLANRDIQGELRLLHLQVRQLPARPGDRTHYGFGPEDGYSFTPPDLEALRDTPAVDAESEQRAALLRQLADKF